MEIYVNNLKKSKNTQIFFDGISVLTGANGAGKSTFARAPYWVLTGKGLPSDVSNGNTDAFFEFGGTSISRSKGKTTTITVNGNKVTEKGLEEVLTQRGLPISVLSSLYSPTTVLEASDLLRAARLKLTADKIIELLSPLDVPEEAELTEAMASYNGEELSLKDVSKLEKLFTERRKALKKEVKALEARILEDDIDEAALEEEKKRLNSELEKLFAKKGKADAEKKMTVMLEKARNEISALIETRNALINEVSAENNLSSDLRNFETEKNSAEEFIRKSNEKLDALTEELDKQMGYLRTASTLLSGKKGEALSISKMLNALSTVKTCPLCPTMPCTADKTNAISSLSADLSAIEADIMSGESSVAEAEATVEGIKADITFVKTGISSAQSELRKLISAISEVKGKISAIDAKKSHIADIDEQISQKEGALFSQSDNVISDERDIEAEIGDVKAKLRNVESQLIKKSENDALLRELSLKKLDCDVSDAVVKKLQSLPEIISAKVTAPLSKVANATIGQLLDGWSVEFQPDGSIIVDVNGKKLNREDISGGEEILLNYVLKVVICRLIGHDNIILDDCDRLDKEHFERLIKAAQAATGINSLFVSCNEEFIPNGVNVIKIS